MLFEVEGRSNPEELRFFLGRLHESFSEAHKGMLRHFITLPLIWAVAYAIREGIISGGEIASFKLEKLELLLLLAPLALGIIGYLLLASINTQSILWQALNRSYKHVLPTAYKLELTQMLVAPSLLGMENLLEPRNTQGFAKKLSQAVWYAVAAYVLVVPPLAILHCAYLAWSLGKLSLLYLALFILMGIMFWVRGFVLLLSNYEMRPYNAAGKKASASTSSDEGTVREKKNSANLGPKPDGTAGAAPRG